MSQTLRVIAKTTIVAINSENGKMYRKMPDNILNAFLSAVKTENQ